MKFGKSEMKCEKMFGNCKFFKVSQNFWYSKQFRGFEYFTPCFTAALEFRTVFEVLPSDSPVLINGNLWPGTKKSGYHVYLHVFGFNFIAEHEKVW